MDKIAIFWHHLGREHGMDAYAGDLRKNSDDVVAEYLRRKVAAARAGGAECVRHDADTLVEFSTDENHPFIICYKPSEGLQYSLGYKKTVPGWLIDIVDIVEMEPTIFCVRDLFVDIRILPGHRYEVVDVNDLSLAFDAGIVDHALMVKALNSLDTALTRLNTSQFPPQDLIDLANEYGIVCYPAEGLE